MGKTIAIVNQKGGVGKTTTAVNLAAAVGKKGYKTLLIDIDPQGNTTSGLGFNKKKISKSSYTMIIGEATASEVILKTAFENLDLMPSDMNLAGAEIEIAEMENRAGRIKLGLAEIKEKYDFIFLDCPPSLGLITVNALAAVDSVIIPIQCEYYALEGLSQLMNTIRQVKKIYNPLIDIEGILLTMFDGRLNLTQQVMGEVKKYFPMKVYSTVIPRNVRLSEAPSFGQPVCYYDKASKGAKAYDEYANEFLLKNNKQPK
ncbi:MAG: ParA family protein [Clostridia bacterium]|nr:ParA family protein [Clostridia bacterium]